jgi:hypothetical protein
MPFNTIDQLKPSDLLARFRQIICDVNKLESLNFTNIIFLSFFTYLTQSLQFRSAQQQQMYVTHDTSPLVICSPETLGFHPESPISIIFEANYHIPLSDAIEIYSESFPSLSKMKI